jgi:hypothetical protein
VSVPPCSVNENGGPARLAPPARQKSADGSTTKMGSNSDRADLAVLTVLGVLVVTVAGCAGSLAPDVPGDGGNAPTADSGVPLVTSCDRAKTILAACLACHSTATAATNGGFDMEVAGWEKKLVGASTPADAPGTSVCRGKNLVYVEPKTQPARGLFLDKLRLATPPCGVQMPTLLPKLNPADTACIEAWANGIVVTASAP